LNVSVVAPARVPLSLYIHLPWCVRKCPYCDFNSFQRGTLLPEAAYVDALIADLALDLDLIDARPLHSIYFGGGTPSLFSGAAITRLLDAVRARLTLQDDCEITLEANPGAGEHDRFEIYRSAGVNRLSLGVQSFDDDQLKRLGRVHDANQALAAFQAARAAGFSRINVDLMYALPGQSLAQARDDLQQAIALAPEHLSYYHLTLEPNTAFAARPPAGLPAEEDAWAIAEQGLELLASAGLAQYEVSAYARPGEASRHNLNYWRFGDYLGIGAGAHGKLTLADGAILRTAKRRNPQAWMSQASGPKRFDSAERIAPDQYLFEFMLNALRLREGVPATLLHERTGLDPQTEPAIAKARARELLVIDPDRLAATALGWRFLNDLQGLFLP
jgi:oxygen-independent coproporphyrinogen-3 oxidase